MPVPCHLIVLSHGLWGTRDHFNYVEKTLRLHLSLNHPNKRFAIYKTKSNEKFKTYDGIDLCGTRVSEEILDETNRLLQLEDLKVTEFSFIGYSLGGIIGRFAIGVLTYRNYFENITPVNFITFCSPHVGVLTPGTSISIKMFNTCVPYFLGKSGRQMFLKDSVAISKNETIPLLQLMAQKSSIFFIGLQKFKNKCLYSNIRSDIRTSWWTSGISYINPFEILDKDTTVSIDPDGFIKFSNGSEFKLAFVDDYSPIILDVDKQIRFHGLIDYGKNTKVKASIKNGNESYVQNWFKRKFKWLILIFNTFIYIPMWFSWFVLYNILQVSTSFYRVARESSRLTEICYVVDQVGNKVSYVYPMSSSPATPLLRPSLSRTLSEGYTMELNKLENELHDQGDVFLDSVFDAITSSKNPNDSIFNQGSQGGDQTLTTSLNKLCSIPIDTINNWEKDYRLISDDKNEAFEYYQVLKAFKLNISPVQREIIANLNKIDWLKFPIYITRTNATHAAAIVRHDDINFEEGKAVIDHFCNNSFRTI